MGGHLQWAILFRARMLINLRRDFTQRRETGACRHVLGGCIRNPLPIVDVGRKSKSADSCVRRPISMMGEAHYI